MENSSVSKSNKSRDAQSPTSLTNFVSRMISATSLNKSRRVEKCQTLYATEGVTQIL